MKNYQDKFEYLANRCNWTCMIGWNKKKDIIPIDSLHHLCHNTKVNRKRYPLFIDSLLNLMPVSSHYHLKNPSYGKIMDRQAEKYERFLERHPKICEFVNGDSL
jgi:hypothetical protein